MNDDLSVGRCLRCHRVIKIRDAEQQYGPVCTKKMEAEECLRAEQDHARKVYADAYDYVYCLGWENNECIVMLSHLQEVLKREYRCDNEKSFYFWTKIEKPSKHLMDCVFAHGTNLTCMQCAFRIQYKYSVLVSR